jgi:FAD:protein FMN transferase
MFRTICVFLLSGLLLAGCDRTDQPDDDLMTLKGPAQGTTFTIKYIDTLQRDLSRSVDSLLKVIDRSLSLWDDNSTVTRFNAADTFTSDDVHFRTMVALSEELWRTTGGAFDPTVLPLVRAWGLGREGVSELDTTAVEALLELTGMDKIAMDERWREQRRTPPMITYLKSRPEVQFDPNGIAQGYTVDVVAMLLESHGITDYMVEIGGEVRARGHNPRGATWTIQIDKPVEGTEHVRQTVVALRDRSLATSGNYRKFIEVEGLRYGHTIDPRTGRPAMNALLSATVIADNCAIADALATAMLVMGPDEARQWLRQHPEYEAYLILDDGTGGYEVWSTPGWPGEREEEM